jgi:hypothetical protein
MNFLFPVFKKDMLHLRLILICWVGLLCVQSFMGIGGAKITADNLELQMILPQVAMFIRFLQVLMVIILVPLLVQSDPLVGTTAFWFTRPIGRKELLVTKVCFTAGILVLLVLLAELFVFAANGFPLKYILLAIPEILLGQTANLILLFLLAIITPKFSRYAIVGVSILAVFITVSILWSFLVIFMPEFSKITRSLSSAEVMKSHTLNLSINVVENIFTILFGSGVIVYQYLRRNTKWTVVWIVVGFVLPLMLGRFWSIDFIKPPAPTSAIAIPAEAVTVTINTDRIGVNDDVNYTKNSVRKKTFTAPVDVSGPASEEFSILTTLMPEIQYPAGDTLVSSFTLNQWGSYNETKFTEPLQAALAQSKILNPFIDPEDTTKHIEYREIFSCDETELQRYKNMTGTYKARAELDIYRYQVRSTLPLSRGSRDKFGPEQIVIFDILDRENGLSVIVGEKKVRLLFDRETEKLDSYLMTDRSFRRSIYLIENIKRGEAFVAEDSAPSVDIDEILNASSRLFTKIKKLDFVYVNKRNGILPAIDKEWLKDARLVRVDAVRVGSVTKQIEIKDFILPVKSTDEESKDNPIGAIPGVQRVVMPGKI